MQCMSMAVNKTLNAKTTATILHTVVVLHREEFSFTVRAKRHGYK